jgi:flagellum-specific peptidoglycan hydrolase FlgJ
MENLKVSFKNTFIGFIIVFSVGFTVLYTLHSIFTPDHVAAADYTVTSLSPSDETEDIIDRDSIMMEMLKIDIVSEIDNYIDKIAPKNDIDSELMFDLCMKYGIDIRFVIAQGQIESHFATKGTAKKTKSVFNVGAYDGHSAVRQTRNGFGFDNANDSIEPYLILLTNDYLVNGKTEYDMMQNYVNYLNQRYASNPNYERMLKSVFNKINTNTNLDILLKEYNELKLA